MISLANIFSLLAQRRSTLMEKVDRPEFEQAIIRVAIGGAVMAYLFWYAYRDGHVDPSEMGVLRVSVGFFAFSLLIAILVLVSRKSSVPRRYLAMIADNSVTTYCLTQMGEGGAVVIGVYLFITFGNGFRYGRRYLHLCQAMGLVGFTSVLLLSNFWSQHVAIGLGFLIGLVVLPFYVGVLAERITDAKKKADEASQAKGRFVANVSHEMRTPLNGVIAMADVLRETNLSESQREIVETMTTSAQLLLAQIEDVLDMSKIEAGRVLIEHRPFDMGHLLSSTVKVVLPQARYKGLEVTTDIADGAAGWFLGDPHHIRQVLLNLLANAVKFTQRGTITLRARALEGLDGQIRVRVEVQDTGIGISLEKQAAIFEPFTQADDSITRVYGGTGLGTTIARHLVHLMKGEIGVQSSAGAGSLFWFEICLPSSEQGGIDLVSESVSSARYAGANIAGTNSSSTKVHKLRGARILVAEDNPTNQRVAQLILESGGHQVTIVPNGEDALDALERGGFDVALFDLSMPIISGLEALKLYRFTATLPIPILILSANVTTDAIAECQRAGAAEFMPKPLRASQLLDAIDRHIAGVMDRAPAQTSVSLDGRAPLSIVETPPLDEEVLRDLTKLSPDPTFVDRLLRGFVADTERLVREITDGLTQRSYEKVKDAAHALKGGAASVGASQLTQLATRIEKWNYETLRLRSTQIIEDLLRTAERATTEVDTFLDQRQRHSAKPS